MSHLENKIAEAVNKKLTDGTVEQLIEKKFEESIENALSSMFGYSGEGRKMIESKLNEVMVPVIEKHDFNQYLVKLDTVLTSIINETTIADNKRILENFKELLKEPDKPEITLSEIFKKYCVHVAKNVDTDHLEACYEDGEPYYEHVTARVEVEHIAKGFASSFDDCWIHFTCDDDKNLNCSIRCYKDKSKDKWAILKGVEPIELNSLASVSDFEVFLWTINRSYTKIIFDIEYDNDDIEPEGEPE